MLYLIAFLEGIITFISPCMLPMLPIYISYFAGGGERNLSTTVKNASGFILGFTLMFVLMGAFAGGIGSFLNQYKKILDIITGIIVIFFGLCFAGVFSLNIFKGIQNVMAGKKLGFFSAMIFGIIFSVGWTPCVGAFLGSALMMASGQGSIVAGVIMLFVYSMGLGIPFLLSALLIDKLKNTFDVIKKNYGIINKVCGGFLVIVGILMMTGLMGRYMALLG